MATSLIGQTVDNGEYKIVERIGTGGMGAVYKAEQPSMNRLVAIKVLHSKFATRDDLVSRFRREARAMSQLSHPNTARVYKFGEMPDGSAYFVMDYMEGKNLAHVVRESGPMEPARALNVMIQVCGALDEAHRAGIVHRDLKPENVFLTEQAGTADFPKVLDFGLAKVTEKQMGRGSMMLTQQGMVFGTPEFMSPEQTQGESLDRRSDIYALGLILYELLTGKLPFDAKKPIDIMKAHVQQPAIPLNERLPDQDFGPELEQVIAKALEKKPEHRYQTAVEFATALRSCLPDQLASTSARRAMPSEPAPVAVSAAPPSQPASVSAAPTVPPVLADKSDPPELPVSRAPLLIMGMGLGVVVALVALWIASMLAK